jgi:hypothetical protein
MVNYLDGTLAHARTLLGVHIRGRKNAQSKCVGKELSGSHPKSREEAQKNLAAAARKCGKG